MPDPAPRTDEPVARVIRVFVSSTFRDMVEEREQLAKHVFPALRKLCESRGVVWGEVDLRWGITEEQSERGEVLPICLDEIQRCRPYFIGLLGERYGWVPDAIPPQLIEREPWLREHLNHSVTELEILHGVLNNPAMADHAFFYFRDPAYVRNGWISRNRRARRRSPNTVRKKPSGGPRSGGGSWRNSKIASAEADPQANCQSNSQSGRTTRTPRRWESWC